MTTTTKQKPAARKAAHNLVPRLYLYVRYSSLKQQDGTSLDRQMRVAREVAAELGLPIEEVMFDKGVSGFTGANRLRGELGAFLARIEAGEIARGSVLIVENQDRLSRERTFTVLGMIEAFRDAGIRVLTADRRELTSDEEMDELITVLDGHRSRKESDRKSELITKGLIEKCERWEAGNYSFTDKGKQGGQIGAGSHPFWIEWDAEARAYRLKADKVRAVKKAIELYRAGFGASLIADRLKEAGFALTDDGSRNRTGSMVRVIRHMMTLPALTGVRQFEIGKQRGRQKDATRVRTYRLKDYYPAIMSPAEYIALQHLREKRGNRGGEKSDLVSVLTGTQVIYCGHCGRPMTAQNQFSRMTRERERTGLPSAGQRRIMCASYVHRTPCPHRGTVQAHLLENAILETCADEFNLAHLMKIDAKHDGLVARAERLRDEVTALEAEREQCGRLALKAKSDEQQEHWMAEQDKVMRAITKKRKDADTLDFEIHQMEGTASSASADVWASLIEGVNALDADTRMVARKLVADTFERIEVFNDGYDYTRANPAVVDVEMVSRRGGVISLQINRTTGDATAKLVTRKRKAATRAAA
jgi:predicted site-specific integrase-resolvase